MRRNLLPKNYPIFLANLKYMKLLAQNYTESEISQQAADQLPWFHLVVLLEKIKDKKERNFYISKAV